MILSGSGSDDWPGVQYEATHERSYRVVRFHFDTDHPDHRKVIAEGLSLDEAQDHCNDERTHGPGWFDGYEEED